MGGWGRGGWLAVAAVACWLPRRASSAEAVASRAPRPALRRRGGRGGRRLPGQHASAGCHPPLWPPTSRQHAAGPAARRARAVAPQRSAPPAPRDHLPFTVPSPPPSAAPKTMPSPDSATGTRRAVLAVGARGRGGVPPARAGPGPRADTPAVAAVGYTGRGRWRRGCHRPPARGARRRHPRAHGWGSVRHAARGDRVGSGYSTRRTGLAHADRAGGGRRPPPHAPPWPATAHAVATWDGRAPTAAAGRRFASHAGRRGGGAGGAGGGCGRCCRPPCRRLVLPSVACAACAVVCPLQQAWARGFAVAFFCWRMDSLPPPLAPPPHPHRRQLKRPLLRGTRVLVHGRWGVPATGWRKQAAPWKGEMGSC